MTSKFYKLYFSYFFLYGAYRGFNENIGFLNNYNKSELFIDKSIKAGLVGVTFLTPFLHPFILYYKLKRLEKSLRHITHTQDDYYF